jgi:prepilin-type N-terminal cleavage/methylation domain-containing protein/prepilin-type processing-associated H-X9-DG protein
MRKRGFTLIELLVVIAIIAILAAILFPVFSRAREQARKAACMSNMKNIATAWMMYLQDWDERVVPYECWGCGGYDPSQPNLRWAVRLQPYIKNLQIFECPSGSTCTLEQWGPCGWAWHFPPEWKGIRFGYGYDLRLAGWHIKGPNGEDTGTGRPLAQVPRPAEVIAIADSSHKDACGNRVTFANTCNVNCKSELNDPNNWPNYTRHTNGSIVIFADGHVKWLDVHYLYQNCWPLHGGGQF